MWKALFYFAEGTTRCRDLFQHFIKMTNYQSNHISMEIIDYPEVRSAAIREAANPK
jgi:hypothetical protein